MSDHLMIPILKALIIKHVLPKYLDKVLFRLHEIDIYIAVLNEKYRRFKRKWLKSASTDPSG